MKIVNFVTIMAFALIVNVLSMNSAIAQSDEKGEVEKVRIKVKELRWEKDKAKKLEAALEEMEGVKKAHVCHLRARAKVKYFTNETKEEEIIALVKEKGYKDIYTY